MGHKINGHAAPLDARIAATLAADVVNKDVLTELLHEAEQASAEAQRTIEVESENALAISNPDPDASDDLVRKAERTIARLNIAIPKLRARVKAIEAYEYNSAWHAKADAVNTRSMQSADRLKHYAKFIVWLQAEFAEVDAINSEIHTLHARAPVGENRRLIEPELLARGLTNFSRANPPLRENLKLPKWDQSSEVAFPRDALNEWNERVAEMNQAYTRQLAAKHAFTTGPDWAAGRDLAVQQEEAAAFKRDAEIKAKEVADKAAFEAKLQENERRRLGTYDK